jgi:hypothetical protein
MAELPWLKRRELHCGGDVVDALRSVSADPEQICLHGQITGIDVIIDPELDSGMWELHEDGEAVMGGRLGQ